MYLTTYFNHIIIIITVMLFGATTAAGSFWKGAEAQYFCSHVFWCLPVVNVLTIIRWIVPGTHPGWHKLKHQGSESTAAIYDVQNFTWYSYEWVECVLHGFHMTRLLCIETSLDLELRWSQFLPPRNRIYTMGNLLLFSLSQHLENFNEK